MKTKPDIELLTKKHLRRIEVRNVDYYINKHLIELKVAMDNEDEDEMVRLKATLMSLSVKRHYLDPKHIIKNTY